MWWWQVRFRIESFSCMLCEWLFGFFCLMYVHLVSLVIGWYPYTGAMPPCPHAVAVLPPLPHALRNGKFVVFLDCSSVWIALHCVTCRTPLSFLALISLVLRETWKSLSRSGFGVYWKYCFNLGRYETFAPWGIWSRFLVQNYVKKIERRYIFRQELYFRVFCK